MILTCYFYEKKCFMVSNQISKCLNIYNFFSYIYFQFNDLEDNAVKPPKTIAQGTEFHFSR